MFALMSGARALAMLWHARHTVSAFFGNAFETHPTRHIHVLIHVLNLLWLCYCYIGGCGGGESNWEIVSCRAVRACVRARGLDA
jgi:hypothetical protein